MHCWRACSCSGGRCRSSCKCSNAKSSGRMPRSFWAVASGRVLPSSVTRLFSLTAEVIRARECFVSAIAEPAATLKMKQKDREIEGIRKEGTLAIRLLLGWVIEWLRLRCLLRRFLMQSESAIGFGTHCSVRIRGVDSRDTLTPALNHEEQPVQHH